MGHTILICAIGACVAGGVGIVGFAVNLLAMGPYIKSGTPTVGGNYVFPLRNSDCDKYFSDPAAGRVFRRRCLMWGLLTLAAWAVFVILIAGKPNVDL